MIYDVQTTKKGHPFLGCTNQIRNFIIHDSTMKHYMGAIYGIAIWELYGITIIFQYKPGKYFKRKINQKVSASGGFMCQ